MIIPVLAAPDPRAEQVSQLLAGETGVVLESSGRWRRLRLVEDGAEGWAHQGGLREVPEGEAAAWRSRAAWSAGALVQVGTERRWLPLRARAALADGDVELPGGETGRVIDGAVRPLARVHQEARQQPPEEWARQRFAGAPYLWGGVTPGGVDCSGLIHTTWLARGVALPRDSARQRDAGQAVPPDAMRAGDLLFFHGEDDQSVNHVAIAGPDATLLHASLGAGGVVTESWLPGQPAAPLMNRLVAIRRIGDTEPARGA
jgi:hypothetical protein